MGVTYRPKYAAKQVSTVAVVLCHITEHLLVPMSEAVSTDTTQTTETETETGDMAVTSINANIQVSHPSRALARVGDVPLDNTTAGRRD